MTRRVVAPRWEWSPVQAELERCGWSQIRLAGEASIAVRAVQRAIVRGFSDRDADRVACALGVHPCSLWFDWFDRRPRSREEIDEARRRRDRIRKQKERWAARNRAYLANWNSEYRLTLSPAARAHKQEANRRWYDRNREREQERARQRYAEQRDAIRARHAAYYQANKERINAQRRVRRAEQRNAS